MKTFLFQMAVQVPIIALLWVVVARDATRLREQHGMAPSGISPFAWGALCGLTWIALIPYLMRRKATVTATADREKNLLPWWIVLAAAAAIWAAVNASQDDANNAAQHTILSATFVVCALIAWSRDRASGAAHTPSSEFDSGALNEPG